MNHRNRSRQSGLAIIDIMFWMVIFSIGITIRAALDNRQAIQLRSAHMATQVREINSALQELLSSEPTFPDGVYTDLNFLRSNTCVDGLADEHYLPCAMTLDNLSISKYFQNITITSTPSAVPGVDVKISTSVFGPFLDRNGLPDPAIAGQVAMAASGYVISANSPVVASVRNFYDIDIDNALVIAVNTANPVSDTWIRTDGSNWMNNHFTFSLDDLGVPRSGVRNASFVEAQNFIDWDDPSFNVDPSGTSNLNDLKVHADIEVVGGGAVYADGDDLEIQARNGGDVNITTDDAINLVPGTDSTDLVYVKGTGYISIVDAVMRLGSDINLTHLLPKMPIQDAWVIDGLNNYVPAPSCYLGANPLVIAHKGREVGIVYHPLQNGYNYKNSYHSTTKAEAEYNGAGEISGWYVVSADTHPNGDGSPIENMLVVTTYCDYRAIY